METRSGPWALLMTTDPAQRRRDVARAEREAERNLYRIGHYAAQYNAEVARLKAVYGDRIAYAPELWDRSSTFCILSRKAAEESYARDIPGRTDSVCGQTLMDGGALVGSRAGRRTLIRARLAAIEVEREAPARMARTRRQQEALDWLSAPDPKPHDPRPFSAWGAL